MVLERLRAGVEICHNRPMEPFKSILIAADLSEHAQGAIEAGMRLAHVDQAAAEVISVLDLPWLETPSPLMPVTTTQKEYVKQAETDVREKLKKSLAGHPGTVEAKLTIELAGSVPKEICETAEKNGHDLIVIGTHQRQGVKRFFLGSVAEMVTRHAPCSVLVVPANAALRTRRPTEVVAATDFSPPSLVALDRARSLAIRNEAAVVAVHVVRMPAISTAGLSTTVSEGDPFGEAADRGEEHLANLLEGRYGAEHGMKLRVAVGTDPARAIADLATDAEGDLLVVGTRGHTGIDRWLMGSVAERVVRHAPCPVLIVR
jgi:nucleotide-binding universal stress UspA family protein